MQKIVPFILYLICVHITLYLSLMAVWSFVEWGQPQWNPADWEEGSRVLFLFMYAPIAYFIFSAPFYD